MTVTGVSAVNRPCAAIRMPPKIAASPSTRGKPNRANTRSAMNLLMIAPIAETKVIAPDWNGLRPKASCSISGSRNGMAPTPMRKNEPPVIEERKRRWRNSFGSSSG
ncbi:hypothetical protein D3C87_1628760 [compost metagenome]